MVNPTPQPLLSTESEFHAAVDTLLARIEASVESACEDVDTDTVGGILTLDFDGGSKVIVNRQTPNREIWVAAKSGGFHFRFDGANWRDTRSGETIDELLSRVVSQQAGETITISLTATT